MFIPNVFIKSKHLSRYKTIILNCKTGKRKIKFNKPPCKNDRKNDLFDYCDDCNSNNEDDDGDFDGKVNTDVEEEYRNYDSEQD